MILSDEQIPAALLPIVYKIAELYAGGDRQAIYVGDADHERLNQGSYSIGLESSYDWPMDFLRCLSNGDIPKVEGWDFDCLTSWCLEAYPDEPFDWPDSISKKTPWRPIGPTDQPRWNV